VSVAHRRVLPIVEAFLIVSVSHRQVLPIVQ
jgi:hypothetical protein